MSRPNPMSPCNLCGAPDPRILYRIGSYPIGRCRACTLTYTTSVPDERELAAQYSAEYYGGREDAYFGYEEDREVLSANFNRNLDGIERHQRPGRLLDVGCALGFFVDAARRRGWDASGVDVSEYATAYARDRLGLPVRTGSLLELDFPAAGFDVITLWDTIEHLADPMGHLRRAAELLRPGGSLYLTTGDVESLYARAFGRRWRLIAPPGHLFYFSRRTLARMLTEAGLRVEGIGAEGKYGSLGAMVHALSPRLASALPPGVRKLRVHFNLGDVMQVRATRPTAES